MTSRELSQGNRSVLVDFDNAVHPELVVAGGDLITEGLTSTPAAAAQRWQTVQKALAAVREDAEYVAIHDAVALHTESARRAAMAMLEALFGAS